METSVKNSVSSGKKGKSLLVIIIIVLILVLAALGFWKKNAIIDKFTHKKVIIKEQQGTNALLDQYKNNLQDLKTKAENSSDSNNLQNYAVAQYATGDLAGAEVTYRKQINVDANNAVAHNNLANALRDQGNYEEAVKEYQQAIKLNPKSTTSYINLANMYQYSLGKTDNAIAVYKDGIDHNADSVDLYVLLGNIYLSNDSKENAEKYFQKALEIQPENVAATAGMKRIEE